jgi:hypothetical protein
MLVHARSLSLSRLFSILFLFLFYRYKTLRYFFSFGCCLLAAGLRVCSICLDFYFVQQPAAARPNDSGDSDHDGDNRESTAPVSRPAQKQTKDIGQAARERKQKLQVVCGYRRDSISNRK